MIYGLNHEIKQVETVLTGLARARTHSHIGLQMNLVLKQTSVCSFECFLLTVVYSQNRRMISGGLFKSSFYNFSQELQSMQRKKSLHGIMLPCKNSWIKHKTCMQRMMVKNKARSHKTQCQPVGMLPTEMVMQGLMETTTLLYIDDLSYLNKCTILICYVLIIQQRTSKLLDVRCVVCLFVPC